MAHVVCDRCRNQFTLGKPKHRWLDKEKGIALKYQQCPKCKTQFPERIQTDEQLAKVRKLRAMQVAANRITDKDAYEEAVTEADLFQLEILLDQEKLRKEHGPSLGFLKRQCPECSLPVTSMTVGKHCVGELEGRKRYRARLLCICGWAGRYADLRKVMEKL